MLWVWAGLTLALLIIFGIALYSASEIVKIPFLAVPFTPRDFDLAYDEFTFESFDHLKLTGWFVPAARGSDATIFVLHGLGSNAGDMLLNVVSLAREGKWNLCLINFRGHASSEGRWTSLGPLELADFESALAYVQKQKPELTRRLAVVGHSLGASVAIVGAAKHPEIQAVLAESPFLSTTHTIIHFARLYYGITAFPCMYLAIWLAGLRVGTSLWHFSPLAEVRKIAPRALFVIQAGRDERMSTENTQKLFDAAQSPKELWVVPGADHGEPWMIAKNEYAQRLPEFFRRVLP